MARETGAPFTGAVIVAAAAVVPLGAEPPTTYGGCRTVEGGGLALVDDEDTDGVCCWGAIDERNDAPDVDDVGDVTAAPVATVAVVVVADGDGCVLAAVGIDGKGRKGCDAIATDADTVGWVAPLAAAARCINGDVEYSDGVTERNEDDDAEPHCADVSARWGVAIVAGCTVRDALPPTVAPCDDDDGTGGAGGGGAIEVDQSPLLCAEPGTPEDAANDEDMCRAPFVGPDVAVIAVVVTGGANNDR